MNDTEILTELHERAPATFLRAMDVCHALVAKGFEPTALEVRKKMNNRGSLEVIQAAVKRYRELSGYVGPETLLPVTLANDLVLAAEAVFKRYQKREAGRLDALADTYAASLESMAKELQHVQRENEALMAQSMTIATERDETLLQLERLQSEVTAVRAKLQLAHETSAEFKGKVAQLEGKIDELHDHQRKLQDHHRQELGAQLASQMASLNKQWEAEVTAWKLRFDAERRALEATREKASQEIAELRHRLQEAQEATLADQRHVVASGSRIQQLEQQLSHAYRDISSREAMIKEALDQSNLAFSRLQEETQALRATVSDREMLLREIVLQLSVNQSPQKTVGAIRSIVQVRDNQASTRPK